MTILPSDEVLLAQLLAFEQHATGEVFQRASQCGRTDCPCMEAYDDQPDD